MQATRELYVYYRVVPATAAEARRAVADFQRALVDAHPGLAARFLRKQAAAEEAQTWMEIWSAPAGVGPSLEAEIADRASAFAHLLQGGRHVEVFMADECRPNPLPNGTMRYDLVDLRLFLHIGELLNLTRAAERSFLSVPSASLRIKQLEENFETPLLIRQAKGMQLTQAGEMLFKHARTVLQQLEVMHADLRPYAKGVKGRVRLHANSTATNTFLADALSAFLQQNPDIDIELEEHPSREINAAVAKGVVDLGIVAGHVEGDELVVLPLYADELVVIANAQAPVAQREQTRLADLLDECRFVGLNQFNSIQAFLDRIAHGLGKRANLRIQVGSYEAVCRMVEAGAGIAVVPRACAQAYVRSQNLCIVQLQDSWARREISLVRRRERLLPEFSEALIRHLVEAAKQQTRREVEG